MTTASAPPPAVPAPAPSPPDAPDARIASPLRVGGAILQLAALGVVGPVAFTVIFTFVGLGFGLLPVLLVGLLFLVALVYVLFAVSWLEAARVDGLYGFGLPPRRPRTSGRPGFGGFLRTLWLQAIDPSVWRGVANAAIATILGWIVLILVGILASGVVLAFAPLFAADAASVRLFRTGIDVPIAAAIPIGILSALIAAAAIIGLAILHGVISRAIMVPSREALLAEQARTSQVQRAGAVRAADVERTRIERDLHDGVQPRLVSVGMTLGMAQQKIDADPEAAKALIAEAHTSTKAAITELRQLARGIHTSVLDDRGLDAALSALASRSPVPVTLDVRLATRCGPAAEAAVYFVIAESLTNAAKHARATDCRVLVRQREGGILWARVEDNGVGGAVVVPGGGLDGLSNRVLGVGGQIRLDSPVGGPTSVEVSVPCAF
ncbi:sensor histidine kinase [Microbacterium ulmi]|uniref:histidine kinase n=1 Tax=Microbacterium ulmi TaxID=179095 RepID=A0A7Y2M1A5_9MICO|nr:histidine kinase [Microbacterium ulmi]NII69072.1 signal transduction histidine kinase [Microbacterium ulmi]NNH04651.1 sensor histidine kinase [Microbacterium ulmi]